MYSFIIVLIILTAILLILVVLTQKSKGGVSSQFGGGSVQMVGVKKTSDLLERITWGLAITMMILAASTTFFVDKSGQEDRIKSVSEQKAKETNLGNTKTQQQQQQQGNTQLQNNTQKENKAEEKK
ncbi:MAG: preprotein translocase subunit SecG [Cytophagales bacterium]|nr:MAG: preprotein translocase subunit SecG [Cytophagales bacterium]